MVGDRKREYLYGEVGEGGQATRMIRQGDFKLIYYPVGNTVQLFDVEADPREGRDLSGLAEHAGTLADMTAKLIAELYGGDEAWAQDGQLVGLANRTFKPGPNRGLASQRGHHWPPPPKTDMQQIVWHVEDNKV